MKKDLSINNIFLNRKYQNHYLLSIFAVIIKIKNEGIEFGLNS